MKRLYILGTDHKHQFGPCNCFPRAVQTCEAFTAYLKHKCETWNVKTLAEEMCIDARIKWGIQRTVAECVAHELSLHHADCDPTERERAELGIVYQGDIIMEGLLYEQSDENVRQNIRAEYDKREQEWIRRLNQLRHEPVLFICGSDHSRSFAKKAGQNGWKTVILEIDWAPIQHSSSEGG